MLFTGLEKQTNAICTGLWQWDKKLPLYLCLYLMLDRFFLLDFEFCHSRTEGHLLPDFHYDFKMSANLV